MPMPVGTAYVHDHRTQPDCQPACNRSNREFAGLGQLAERFRLRLAKLGTLADNLAGDMGRACVLGMSRAAVGLLGPVFVELTNAAPAIGPAPPMVGVPPLRPIGIV
jgi:hypothetical protein